MPLKNDWLHLGIMMQVSTHLAFSYTKRELFASENTCRHILDVSQSESDLHLFFAHKKHNTGTLFVSGGFQ